MATKVGVDRGFAMRICRGIRAGAQDSDRERICKRFWMALILTDVIAEASRTLPCMCASALPASLPCLRRSPACAAALPVPLPCLRRCPACAAAPPICICPPLAVPHVYLMRWRLACTHAWIAGCLPALLAPLSLVDA